MTDVEPRRILRPDSASILQWLRMVQREFGDVKNGLLGDRDEYGQEAMQLATAVALSINGKTGKAENGVRYYARMAGYQGNGHGMGYQLDRLLALGFLTQDGERNRAKVLRLSVPEKLVDSLSQVKNNGYGELIEHLKSETVAVADLRTATKGDSPSSGVGKQPSSERLIDPFAWRSEECPDCHGTRGPRCGYVPYGECDPQPA